jgi:hypothetical protein
MYKRGKKKTMNQRWTDNTMGNRQRTDNTMDRQYKGQTIQWTNNTMDRQYNGQ